MSNLAPENEVRQKQAAHTYALLDPAAEQAYDDLTMLASRVCRTPIALISLVDHEHQWFKSKLGQTIAQLPHESAFCAQAILKSDEVLVVNDALKDPRFSRNPMVMGDPKIRFYAGAPLIDSSGQALGTMCVLDHVPHDLEMEQIEALRALARQVVGQLELRRTITEQEQQALALAAYQKQLEDYQRLIEKANAELAIQTATDSLTGLMNRRAFDARLEAECQQTTRHQYALSLLMVDIDAFKSYNDEFGHPAGDEALRFIAQVLLKKARKCDYVARYGGEEFAVILPHTGIEGAIVIAERLRHAVEKSNCPNRQFTISVGVQTALSGVIDLHGLITQADTALYQAKRHGRNQVVHVQHIMEKAD